MLKLSYIPSTSLKDLEGISIEKIWLLSDKLGNYNSVLKIFIITI